MRLWICSPGSPKETVVVLGCGSGAFCLVYAQLLFLFLSLPVTEESIMPETHKRASFLLPEEEWQGQWR